MLPILGVILLAGLIGAAAPLHAQNKVTSTNLPATANTYPAMAPVQVQPIEPAKPVSLVEPVADVEKDDGPETAAHYEQAIDHPRVREVSEKTEKVYRFYPLKFKDDSEINN